MLLTQQVGQDARHHQRVPIGLLPVDRIAQLGEVLVRGGELIAGHDAAQPFDLFGPERLRVLQDFADIDRFKRCQGRGWTAKWAGDSRMDHALLLPSDKSLNQVYAWWASSELDWQIVRLNWQLIT